MRPKINIKTKRKIVSRLKQYAKKMDSWVKPTSSIKRMRIDAANDFLFGVIFDFQSNAEGAWSKGETVRELLGDNPWGKIRDLSWRQIKYFIRFGNGGKSFHRFPNTISERLIDCAELMINYNDDPRTLWRNAKSVEHVKSEFEKVPGIGSALANMAVLILVRNYGLIGGKKSLSQLDPKPDEHVRRVFKRTGLCEHADFNEVVEVARKLNPQYPAELDAPAWEIGRYWCKPTKPNCTECFLGNVCRKIGIKTKI